MEIFLKHKSNLNIDITLNSELENVSDWLKVNKLSLNIAKWKYMIFHMPQKALTIVHRKYFCREGSRIFFSQINFK